MQNSFSWSFYGDYGDIRLFDVGELSSFTHNLWLQSASERSRPPNWSLMNIHSIDIKFSLIGRWENMAKFNPITWSFSELSRDKDNLCKCVSWATLHKSIGPPESARNLVHRAPFLTWIELRGARGLSEYYHKFQKKFRTFNKSGRSTYKFEIYM